MAVAPPPAPSGPVVSVSAALLTVSDRAHHGTYEDKSGPAMAAILTGASNDRMKTIKKPLVVMRGTILRV
jgi:molybdopterin biosynthesis enzyme MoaB